MLDDGECAKAVHFQFVNPVGIIERSGPLQERHWLEIHHLPFTAFTRIMICGTHFGANSRIAGSLRQERFALLRCSDDSQNVNPACPSPRKISRMRACRLSYSRASTAVMATKTASARALACCLESAESSAERFFVNVATVSLHSRNRPSPIFGGGQLRKLRNIIHSPKRVWVPCQIVPGARWNGGSEGKGRYRRLDTI